MIEETHECRQCGSADLVKNGHDASGSRQYHCKACGTHLVLDPKERGYLEEEKERILRAYRERGSMRAIERISGVSRNTLSRWVEKKERDQPDLSATVEPPEADKRWLWTAMCRRTRQIVAFVIGDRSARTCAWLWAKIPEGYRKCRPKQTVLRRVRSTNTNAG